MRFLESVVSLALIIAAVALVSVYFARGREPYVYRLLSITEAA